MNAEQSVVQCNWATWLNCIKLNTHTHTHVHAHTGMDAKIRVITRTANGGGDEGGSSNDNDNHIIIYIIYRNSFFACCAAFFSFSESANLVNFLIVNLTLYLLRIVCFFFSKIKKKSYVVVVVWRRHHFQRPWNTFVHKIIWIHEQQQYMWKLRQSSERTKNIHLASNGINLVYCAIKSHFLFAIFLNEHTHIHFECVLRFSIKIKNLIEILCSNWTHSMLEWEWWNSFFLQEFNTFGSNLNKFISFFFAFIQCFEAECAYWVIIRRWTGNDAISLLLIVLCLHMTSLFTLRRAHCRSLITNFRSASIKNHSHKWNKTTNNRISYGICNITR